MKDIQAKTNNAPESAWNWYMQKRDGRGLTTMSGTLAIAIDQCVQLEWRSIEKDKCRFRSLFIGFK